MKNNDLDRIIFEMSAALPPSDISIIEDINNIDWNNISDSEIGLCSDILIRLRVDCIMLEGYSSNPDFIIYVKLLNSIYDKVIKSGIDGRSEDFKTYLEDFHESLSDL
jgi:hypothetical protein